MSGQSLHSHVVYGRRLGQVPKSKLVGTVGVAIFTASEHWRKASMADRIQSVLYFFIVSLLNNAWCNAYWTDCYFMLCLKSLLLQLTVSIGVGDGGKEGTFPPPKKKFRKKYFLGNYYVKFGHFSGKSPVKFQNFVNFSIKYHKNSGILIIFRITLVKFRHFVNYSGVFFRQKCSGKNVLPPKVDWAPTPMTVRCMRAFEQWHSTMTYLSSSCLI